MEELKTRITRNLLRFENIRGAFEFKSPSTCTNYIQIEFAELNVRATAILFEVSIKENYSVNVHADAVRQAPCIVRKNIEMGIEI